jgi:hypothetical protein
MRVLEAKDFLVQQTAEQAALESVPLSDLEKRMMYFTETDECPEDPIALNDAFEEQYETAEYEAKISKLMHHVHSRIKKENPESARKWKEAVQQLSKGDHYILILCNPVLDLVPEVSTEHPPYDSLKLLGTGILLAAALVGFAFLGAHYGVLSGGSSKGRYVAPSGTHTLMPLWLERPLWFLMVGAYLYYLILPWILKKPSPGPVPVLSKLFRREISRSRRR